MVQFSGVRPAEWKEPARISDVIVSANFHHSRVLYGAGIEAIDTWTKGRLIRDSLEMIAVITYSQAEVTFVLGTRFSGSVQECDFFRFLVVPGSGIEYGQLFPPILRIWGQDRITFISLQFHRRHSNTKLAWADCLRFNCLHQL